MRDLSPKQAIEYFHLLFLAHLGKQVDRKAVILKGGCNLRFFMQSIRYSEDIDLDVTFISKETLQKNVEKILDSKSFQQSLKASEISIKSWSTPKQTETTQRWKVVIAQGVRLPLHTKLEFSRRSIDSFHEIAEIDLTLIQHYKLFPIFVNHYDINAAIQQKIDALALRSETQCRDIFDLYFLFSKPYERKKIKVSEATFKKAKENALSLTYDYYKAQVVAFLQPDYQTLYDSTRQWEAIQLKVFEHIEKANESH